MDEGIIDEHFKILLLGESGVGKSSLLLRYIDDTFKDLQATIGVDFRTKKLNMAGKRIKLTLWDTAGQERFRTLTTAYYRGAQGVFFVFDVTRKSTFESLQNEWLVELVNSNTHEDIVKMVVGNKIDLDGRQVSREDAVAFARSVGAIYMESSAKNDTGVGMAFETMVETILKTPSLCSGGTSTGNLVIDDFHNGAGDPYNRA